MKISIITAVLNRKNTIGDAINSLQRQKYKNFEHIIQDGGSNDGTLDVIQRMKSSNMVVTSENDSGIYNAINKGIFRSSGDIVGLMHSDDFFANDYVLSKVANMFNDNKIDGVYGDLDYVSASEPSKVIRHWKSGVYRKELLQKGWMPPHPTLYLRRGVFDKWGLYDTSYHIAADYDAMLRFLWCGNVRLAYIPEVMVKMRLGGESNRSIGRILRKSREDYLALKRNKVGGFTTLIRKNTSKFKQLIIK
ncbi:glycosyltransferase [Amylibacter sp.]|nr:glycosyltransferase [Amylibacter sp.]